LLSTHATQGPLAPNDGSPKHALYNMFIDAASMALLPRPFVRNAALDRMPQAFHRRMSWRRSASGRRSAKRRRRDERKSW
jgi:hypothetical protein